jgi:hypothetical protein
LDGSFEPAREVLDDPLTLTWGNWGLTMARRPAAQARKIEIVRRYYKRRVAGDIQKVAAKKAGASIPTIEKWEKELEAQGVQLWPK